jgi:helix-turn-helix protein
MSMEASGWALEKRGLSPLARWVIWHLADLHDPDYGCFPGLAYVSAKCEITMPELKKEILALEKMGLLSRIEAPSPDESGTKSIRYILEFEMVKNDLFEEIAS